MSTTWHSGSFNHKALARARATKDLKGYAASLPATTMTANQVISSCHDLWHVEQSFRISKRDLRARPVCARTPGGVEAHLTVVFMALAISRSSGPHRRLDLRKVLRQLRPLRSVTLAINGSPEPPLVSATAEN